ncbi:MAG: hypothetical protein ACOCZM_02790 [Bacillota bacterium]
MSVWGGQELEAFKKVAASGGEPESSTFDCETFQSCRFLRSELAFTHFSCIYINWGVLFEQTVAPLIEVNEGTRKRYLKMDGENNKKFDLTGTEFWAAISWGF